MVFKKGNIPWHTGTHGLKPAWNKGHIGVSDETSRKIRENHVGMLGKTHTKEARDKVSMAQKGRVKTDMEKQKIADSLRGKKLSEGCKQKLSIKFKGRKPWNTDKHLSEEHKNKIKVANTGRKHTVETIQKLRGRKLSEEHRKKLSGENSINWNGGISFEPYCRKFNRLLKEHIRKRDNNCCQLCGKEGGISKLTVHHVHYDKPNCNPNLISLCRSCHGKTNHNKDYWEKFFMDLLKRRGLFIE